MLEHELEREYTTLEFEVLEARRGSFLVSFGSRTLFVPYWAIKDMTEEEESYVGLFGEFEVKLSFAYKEGLI